MSKDIIPDENQKKKINQTNTSNMKDNSKSKEDIDILENDKTMNSENKKGPPKACLFVASFHPNTTEKALFDFFSPFGNLLKVKLQKDKLGRPYAFVQYQNEKDAENALEKVQNKTLDGRIIRVEKAKVHRTLFLAKLDKSMTSSQIRQIVEVYGPVESVSLIRNYQTNKSKGCAFVKFVFREDAIKAFTSLKNLQKKWAVEWATSPNDPEALGIDKCNIFVGGLNSSLITKELLEQKFSSYGTIENISLIKRSNNNQMSVPKNSFAFIRYKDPESSIPAIENENGSEWLGEKIRVQYCQTQEMKEKKKN
jgi:RNA recognition motif-containing protein